MMFNPPHSLTKILLTWVPLALVSACGGGGSEDNLDDRLGVADPKVRFINTVPLSPDLALYRETVQQPNTQGGYQFASKYFDTSTSSANWTVRSISGDVNVGSTVLDPARGNKYSFIAVPGSSSVDLAVIRDPYNKGLVSDKARVRVFNASFTQSNVDVYLTPSVTLISTVSPNFGNVAYKTSVPASGSDSTEFDGGTYQLRITNVDSKTELFSAPVALSNNADWLVVTLPDLTVPGGVKVLLVKADDDARTSLEVNTQ